MIAPDRRAAEWALRLGLIHLKEHQELTNLVLERLKLTKTGLAHLRISGRLGAPFDAVVRRNL